jgi:hypothetical protein
MCEWIYLFLVKVKVVSKFWEKSENDRGECRYFGEEIPAGIWVSRTDILGRPERFALGSSGDYRGANNSISRVFSGHSVERSDKLVEKVTCLNWEVRSNRSDQTFRNGDYLRFHQQCN